MGGGEKEEKRMKMKMLMTMDEWVKTTKEEGRPTNKINPECFFLFSLIFFSFFSIALCTYTLSSYTD